MTIVIIEDEVQTAWEIRQSIEKLRPEFSVAAVLDSVETALNWFAVNDFPDLIFSDIQLGDGLAFEIYRKIRIPCPVIFCTAYDEYAMLAFKNNGVDYLLKPVTEKELENSLKKIELFKQTVGEKFDDSIFRKALQEIAAAKNYKTTFLIPYRDKLIPVSTSEIRLFCILNDAVVLYTTDDKHYQLSQTLDQLEEQLDPKLFYRANRQHIIAFHAVKEVEHASERKLSVTLSVKGTEPVIVSKAKASGFIKWMENR